MSLNSFIPEIWSGEILAALRQVLVFDQVCNDDYEGEISNVGDTVRIHMIGDITISNYVKNTDLAAPQELADAETTLAISQAKSYNFAIDDVDAAQQNPKVMQEAMSWAAYKLAQQIDKYVAGLFTDAGVSINGGSAVSPLVATDTNTGSTAFDYLTDMQTALKENDVPMNDIWAVVPPWVYGMLFKDRRFTNYGTPDSRSTISSGAIAGGPQGGPPGLVGLVNGMKIYESNNCNLVSGTYGAASSVNTIMVGHTMAITLAHGLTKTEAFRSPTRFADVVRGLALYGAKVVRPQALCSVGFTHP